MNQKKKRTVWKDMVPFDAYQNDVTTATVLEYDR